MRHAPPASSPSRCAGRPPLRIRIVVDNEVSLLPDVCEDSVHHRSPRASRGRIAISAVAFVAITLRPRRPSACIVSLAGSAFCSDEAAPSVEPRPYIRRIAALSSGTLLHHLHRRRRERQHIVVEPFNRDLAGGTTIDATTGTASRSHPAASCRSCRCGIALFGRHSRGCAAACAVLYTVGRPVGCCGPSTTISTSERSLSVWFFTT